MREPIEEKRVPDSREAVPDIAHTKEQRADDYRQAEGGENCFVFNGYTIHERFDRDGPSLADCIVRAFA